MGCKGWTGAWVSGLAILTDKTFHLFRQTGVSSWKAACIYDAISFNSKVFIS